VTLFIHGHSDSLKLSYVLDSWGGTTYEGPWLYNKRNIGALTFLRFTVYDSATVGTADGPVTAALAPELGADPNPFNPSLNVRYSVIRESRIAVSVYSVNGRLIRALFDGVKKAGHYTAVWDGRDNAGRALGSGVYVLSFKGQGMKLEKRVVMLK
jgi:hypothetical protein